MGSLSGRLEIHRGRHPSHISDISVRRIKLYIGLWKSRETARLGRILLGPTDPSIVVDVSDESALRRRRSFPKTFNIRTCTAFGGAGGRPEFELSLQLRGNRGRNTAGQC